LGASLDWQKLLPSGTSWTMVASTIADILLVAIAVYWLIMLSKRTRAWQIIWGLLIFLVLTFVTEKLQLNTLNFLLRAFLPLGPVAIVILFFPELRSALENVGRVAGWSRGFAGLGKEDVRALIPQVVRAVCSMAESKTGALVVIERESNLGDIAATGSRLDAVVSEELLKSIFFPGNPLHDGAVIIRGNRVLAAGCTLPLTESTNVGYAVHTRHKAALGTSETTDALSIIVSEETGTISVAFESKLHRNLNDETLSRWLMNILGGGDHKDRTTELARKVNGTFRRGRMKQK
jgi:diadenylate cyclase